MGLAASSGHDNDDLIDKLIEANIVITHRVETALRQVLVDRRRFFPVEGRYIAYKDLAWKSDFGSPGRIHISAPCIYGNVLECLDLREGNSFLNVGSGTGYLSTVAGYLLGSSGTNHGVEIHPNIVEYARSLVVETLRCPETQCYDWAIPEFACGNGLHLSPSHYSKYDRVYCGAAVPPSHRRILWELLKIDGILVMPYEDQLLQVRRQAPNVFEVKIITSVSFSDFIPPTEEETSKELYTSAPPFKPIPTLQFLCALSIRKIIRAAVAVNHKIYIRNFTGQQPERIRENHVVVEFRDGEPPVAQRAYYENRQPPFREILAIVGADFVGDDENEDNDEVEEVDPERRRRLARERFRMVWFRHHLRAHITNRALRRRQPLEAGAYGEDAGTEDGQNSDVEIINGNENSEYSGSGSSSATTSDPADTSIDTTESYSDILTTGRSKKRSLVEHEGESSLSAKRRNDDDDDKETMETDLVNDCRVESIPKQDLPVNSRLDSGRTAAAMAQETLAELGRSANQKNEENASEHLGEGEDSKDMKFVEEHVKNNEQSMSRTKEMVEKLRDFREKEVERRSNVQSSLRNQVINSSDSNHDRECEQDSSRSIQFQSSEMHCREDRKRWAELTSSSNTVCPNFEEIRSILESNRCLPSGKDLDSEDNELMWQNNKLYKNRSEVRSAERFDSNNEMVDTGDSWDANELYLAVRRTTQSVTTAIQASHHNTENGDESDSSDDDYHDAVEDESMSHHRRDAGDELQTEEEKKREQARLEERERQLSDIRTFASLFEHRIMELPLNRALKEYIKCLC
uniref:Protein-L-isoaspartate O-methyltransferase domain-containing protein 1 n=1 Tax=Elaeophora elaphi TaxID=1147741 RepID=A0A158Q7Y9_9BILA